MSDVLQQSAPLLLTRQEGGEGQAARVFVFPPAPGERLVVNTPSLSLSLFLIMPVMTHPCQPVYNTVCVRHMHIV